MNRLFEQLFALLRLGLGIEAVFSFEPYADDWRKLHDEAVRQSVSGVAPSACAAEGCRLPIETR